MLMLLDNHDTSFFLYLIEKLLSMRPDLRTRPSFNILLHALPVFTVESKAYNKIWVNIKVALLLTQYELLVLLLCPSAHGRASTLVSPVVVRIKCLGIKDSLNISLMDPGPLSISSQAVELACPLGVVRCRSYV